MIVVINVRGVKNTLTSKKIVGINKSKKNYLENNKLEEKIFYTGLNAQEKVKDIWYIDSGCSNHITGDKNYFVTLDENVKTHITQLATVKKKDVAGKETIAVKTRNAHQN